MAEAAAIGIPAHHFWHLTYRELAATFRGHRKRMLRERKESMSIIWHGAMFQRAKKLPPHKRIMQNLEPPKPMSRNQLKQQLFAIGKTFGAEIIYKRKGDSPET